MKWWTKKAAIQESQEGWNGGGDELTEACEGFLAEARVDGLTLRNVAIVGPISKNRRRYPAATLEAAIPLFQGSKVFLNHPLGRDAMDSRDVRDLIGEFQNVHLKGTMLVGDLSLADIPLVKETVLPLAKSKPHLFGASIAIRGQTSKPDKDGMVTVEHIESCRSIDIVSEPGATDKLFAEAIHRDETAQRAQALAEENEALKAQLAAMAEETKGLRLSLDETQRHAQAINALLAQAPMTTKQKENLKPLLTRMLQEGCGEATLQEVISRNCIQVTPVISEGKVLFESEQRRAGGRGQQLAEAFNLDIAPAVSQAQQQHLYEAFTSDPQPREQSIAESYALLLEQYPHLRPRDAQAAAVMWYGFNA
jgi:hypothetical protein